MRPAPRAKTLVVEHKGNVERPGVFFIPTGVRSADSAVGQNRFRVRQMFDARISVRNHPNSQPAAKISCPGVPTLDVNDLGGAEKLLSNPRHLGERARELIKREMVPTEDGWGGWLGKYQAALCKAAREIEERKERNLAREQKRQRVRSVGR